MDHQPIGVEEGNKKQKVEVPKNFLVANEIVLQDTMEEIEDDVNYTEVVFKT